MSEAPSLPPKSNIDLLMEFTAPLAAHTVQAKNPMQQTLKFGGEAYNDLSKQVEYRTLNPDQIFREAGDDIIHVIDREANTLTFRPKRLGDRSNYEDLDGEYLDGKLFNKSFVEISLGRDDKLNFKIEIDTNHFSADYKNGMRGELAKFVQTMSRQNELEGRVSSDLNGKFFKIQVEGLSIKGLGYVISALEVDLRGGDNDIDVSYFTEVIHVLLTEGSRLPQTFPHPLQPGQTVNLNITKTEQVYFTVGGSVEGFLGQLVENTREQNRRRGR